MKVMYIGPYEGVDVPLPSGDAVHAERDQVIDIHADVAKALLVQEDIWTAPGAKANSKEAK
jgi:hypothetical protein